MFSLIASRRILGFREWLGRDSRVKIGGMVASKFAAASERRSPVTVGTLIGINVHTGCFRATGGQVCLIESIKGNGYYCFFLGVLLTS